MQSILLSEAEKNYMLKGIQDDIRNDGRNCNEFREMELELDVVSNTNGSARLRLANTDVLVGIKAEVEVPKLQNSDEGRIEIFIDCSANAAPEFEGRGGEEIANELSTFLTHAYTSNSTCLDLKSLCVSPGKFSWVLYIDVVILEMGGNLFDVVSIATKAALNKTRIPKVSLVSDEDGQTEVELSDDPYDFTTLNVEHLPCIITVSRVGDYFIVDSSIEEEQCSQVMMTFCVTNSGSITASRKFGKGSLHPESLIDAMQISSKVGKSIHSNLDKLLQEYVFQKKDKIGFLR